MTVQDIPTRVLVALLALICLLGVGWYAYDWAYDRGADSVQRKWDSAKAAQDRASAKVALDALATTKSLQESADNERKAKNDQIDSLNRKLDSAIAGLRNRPSRASAVSVPKSAGAGTLCTGAGLYREDGEFLAREFARAKALTIQLASCEADYARIAAQLNGKPVTAP